MLQQVSNEVLEPKHVAEIVRTLDLEGKIEIVERDEIEVFRPALLTIPEKNAFTSVPCGVCPVSHPASALSLGRQQYACCSCCRSCCLVMLP